MPCTVHHLVWSFKPKWEFSFSLLSVCCLFSFPLPHLTSPSVPTSTLPPRSVSLRHWRELLRVTLSHSFPYQLSPFLCSIPLVWEAVDSKFSVLSISYCLFLHHRRCQMFSCYAFKRLREWLRVALFCSSSINTTKCSERPANAAVICILQSELQWVTGKRFSVLLKDNSLGAHDEDFGCW